MELVDAIKHAEAVAQAKEREAKENRNHGGWAYDDEATKCSACAAEHRQLAEWLKELKAVHDEIDDADDEDEIFIGYLREKMRGER